MITSIPSEIGLVTNLRTLWLSKLLNSVIMVFGFVEIFFVTIKTFANNIFSDDNQITQVPSEIGLLTNLRDLDLGEQSDSLFGLVGIIVVFFVDKTEFSHFVYYFCYS